MLRSSRARVVLFTAVTVAALGAAREAQAAGDFLVNSHTTDHQYGASARRLAGGDFVVAWHMSGEDDLFGVWVRRFDPSGTPLGPQVRVNAYTTGFQGGASVAADPAGGFVIVWASNGQDGDNDAIVGRRYDASGASLGDEFLVNTFTESRQWQPAVAVGPSGGFVVVWSSFGGDGMHYGVMGQRYDATGAALGSEFQVNTFTTYIQANAEVAMDGTGRFVVVWSSAQDVSSTGIFGQRFEASGLPLGPEFPINTFTTGPQGDPDVAADADGNFVAVWTGSGDQDGGGGGVFAQRYDATGAAQGPEFRVNTYTTGAQDAAAVAWDDQGHFLVSWTSDSQDGSDLGVFARRYRADGAALGPEFRINAYTTGQQSTPAVATVPDGGFLVAWTDWHQQGASDIYGRIIPDLIFADGVESAGLGAWSSAATGGGDLSVSPAAALVGTQGLQAVVDDTAGLFVQDDLPEDEGRYRARFWLDPNGFDPGESAGKRRTRVLLAFQDAPTRRLMAVVLRRISGQYALMGRARRDDNSQANTGFFAISDAPHAVEVAWSQSSTPDASDGTLEMWIDGALVSSLSGLDNHASGIDFVRLGALSVKTAAGGTLFFDAFDSRRASYVGP